MAEDKKKSKIDLKARLGKSSMSGAPGAQVPLPTPGAGPGPVPPSDPGSPSGSNPPPPAAAPSGAGRVAPPQGIAPPMAITPGIAPPFAQQKAAPPPPKPSAAQQTIKVEVGEEIHAERKKAKRNMWLAAAGGVALGVLLGFVMGSGSERRDRGLEAVKVAQDLEKDVKAANDKIKDLADKIEVARTKYASKTFPTELDAQLADLNIPFDAATNVANKKVGSLKSGLLKPLLIYTLACEDLNKAKDDLRNALVNAQKQSEKKWAEEKEPMVAFSVLFGPEGSKGMAATLVNNKDPFKLSEPWKDGYDVLRLEQSQQGPKLVPKKATRWQKGDLTGSDPIVIPLQPASVSLFLSEKDIDRFRQLMGDVWKKIKGNENDPNAPPGLMKLGDDLANELHKSALVQ